MKSKTILRVLVGVASVGASGAAFLADFSPIAASINPALAQTIAIALPALLGLKEIAVVVGDYMDDGQRNNSFRAGK